MILKITHWGAISLFCFVLALTSHEAKSDGTALGWSSDGKTWAFLEEGDFGEGSAVDDRVFFNLIDTAKNTFFKQYKKKISEEDEYGDDEAQIVLKKFKEAKLSEVKGLGVSIENGTIVYQAKPYQRERHSSVKQFGDREVEFLVGKDLYALQIDDRFYAQDVDDISSSPPFHPISAKSADTRGWSNPPVKSKFTISCRKNNGPWKILQKDKKAWRSLRSYQIQHVSISPNNDRIAILIEGVETGFEMHKTIYCLGVTGVLPG